MVFGKIYTYPNNPRVQQTLVAAKYNGLDVEVVPITFGVDNKSPEFLGKFPLGKVPAFEGSDGFCLFESSAIAKYGKSLAAMRKSFFSYPWQRSEKDPIRHEL